MIDDLQIPERIEIDNIEALKALSDPIRLEILKLVGLSNREGQRCTVKQLGALMDKPPTKLYYHVNLLEDHGLLVVGDTKIVSGIIEKHYQVCAMNIGASQDLLGMNDPGERSGMLAQMMTSIEEIMRNSLDNLNKSLQVVLNKSGNEKNEHPAEQKKIPMDASSSEVFLTEEQVANYLEKLQKVHNEFSKQSDENLKSNNIEAVCFGVTQLIAPHYHRKKLNGK